MNDMSPAAVDTETPVNPYSLLEAVNRSSDSANRAWLLYIALMSYLLITVAGVSHKDLLLDADVTLPILGVKIGLKRFFLLAPILVVLVHAGLLGQLALLARKTLEFTDSLRMLEASDRRTHPLRLELDNFFFVQALAGPERSRLFGVLLHGLSWLTIVALPVLLLVYVQLAFLPYHDAAITGMHRLALIADVGLLMFIGVFLCRAEASYLRALLRTSLHHPVGLTFTALLLAGATAFSLFVATVPGEAMDEPASAPRQAGEGRYVFGYAVPQLAGAEAPLLGLFHRNLSVSDVSLLPDKEVRADAVSINLRGRDLRFASLDRADLRQADLTGANLEGASLAGADLRGAAMGCFEPAQLQPGDNPRGARCTNARGANLSRSRLSGARMSGIDLRGARLEEARIEDAHLDHAVMVGANFTAAGLDRADLTGAWLYGAAFVRASLQGADLSRARLQMADLSGAALQGASLASASLEAASLRDADLEGANLQMARLYGADLTGARLQGSDMKAAYIWRTAPPVDGLGFSDLAQIIVQPPAEDQLTAFAALARLQSGALKTRAADGLAALADAAQNGAWSVSSEQQAWQGLAKASEATMADGYRGRLTDYLARLACRPRFAGGAVATGVARRATAQGFRGDAAVLYDRLRGADCPVSTAVNARTMRDLAAAADAAREAGPPISVPAPPAPVPAQPRAP